MKYYYLNHNSIELGPYMSFELLDLARKGELKKDTAIRKESDSNYCILSEIEPSYMPDALSMHQLISEVQRFSYKKDSKEHGPCTAKELKRKAHMGILSSDTLVCEEGSNVWIPFGETALHKIIQIQENSENRTTSGLKLRLKNQNSESSAQALQMSKENSTTQARNLVEPPREEGPNQRAKPLGQIDIKELDHYEGFSCPAFVLLVINSAFYFWINSEGSQGSFDISNAVGGVIGGALLIPFIALGAAKLFGGASTPRARNKVIFYASVAVSALTIIRYWHVFHLLFFRLTH